MNATQMYWLKQAVKHENTANTLIIKYLHTNERRWLKSATTNQRTAKRIRATYNLPLKGL